MFSMIQFVGFFFVVLCCQMGWWVLVSGGVVVLFQKSILLEAWWLRACGDFAGGEVRGDRDYNKIDF